MRNHKSLAAAITTALSFTPGIAGAIVGNQLDNVNNTADANKVLTTEELFKGLLPNYYLPEGRFDFTAGESIIMVPAEGVTFASELFSTGTLTLPTPLTGQNTGQYMAVVYTIDGDVTADFEMTFTLDNGATFAVDPWIGVRDAAAGGESLVQPPGPTANGTAVGAGWSMQLDNTVTSLATDTIFRFDTDSTVYQVAKSADNSMGVNITFYQLGKSDVVPTALAIPEKFYKPTGTGVAGKVDATAVATVSAAPGTNGATLLLVNSVTKFTQGWNYQCSSGYGTTAGNGGSNQQTVFTVSSIDAAKNQLTIKARNDVGLGGFDASAVTTTALASGGSGFGTAGSCATGDAVYRVHVKGESVISVVSAAAFSKNSIYSFDNLGASLSNSVGASNVISHQVAQYAVSATDTTKNTITIGRYCKTGETGCTAGAGLGVTLQANLSNAEQLYSVAIPTGDDWVATENKAKVPQKGSGVGQPTATFTLNAGATMADLKDLKLHTNDQIMLLYKLGNANALAEPAQSINMSVELKTPSLKMFVNPSRTVTVAKSAQAINAQVKSIEAGKLNIAVSTGSTQFSGEATDGLVGFKDNYIAQIGQVLIKDGLEDAMMEDGVTLFQLKGSGGGVLAGTSTLTITGGQFQASTALPGRISLDMVTGGGLEADQYTQDAAGWTAVWNLTTDKLEKIVIDSEGNGGRGALIMIQTDGTTPVNTVENQPHATLEIKYDTATYQDVTVESDIRKITKDGTVCTVYNVPPPKKGVIGADSLSIRVTNDSALSGKLMGKLYSQEGGDPIWSGDLTTEEVAAGATVRFTSEDLATITGQTWDGRAVLEISTILPKIEVLALIRQNGIRMAPLSSLSSGAHGTSCAQD